MLINNRQDGECKSTIRIGRASRSDGSRRADLASDTLSIDSHDGGKDWKCEMHDDNADEVDRWKREKQETIM